MPWPFDDTGDNPLIAGILTGQKLRAINQDYELSELRKQQLAQELGHREQMNQFDLLLAQKQTERADQDLTLGKLQKQAAEFEQSLQPDVAATRKAQRTSAESQSRVAVATEGPQIESAQLALDTGKNNLESSKLEVLGKRLGVLGTVSTAFGSSPIDNAGLDQILDEADMPKGAGRQVWKNFFTGLAQQQKEKTAYNEALIAQLQQTKVQQDRQFAGTVFDDAVKYVKTFDDATIRGMAAADPNDLAAQAAVKMIESGGLRSGVDTLPAGVQEKYYEAAARKSQLESQIAALRGGGAPTDNYNVFARMLPGNATESARQQEIASLSKELENATRELQVYSRTKAAPTAKQPSTIKPSKSTSAIPQALYPAPDATDAELAQSIPWYKTQGYDLTLADLQKLRDSQRKSK